MAGQAAEGTRSVRGEDAFDTAKVDAWLKERVEGLTGAPEVRRFSAGASNRTYLLSYPERELILRCPPAGRKASSAHDMSREYRVQRQLHDVGPAAAGLADLGKGAGYVARPVRDWSDRYRKARTWNVPKAEGVMAWLDWRARPIIRRAESKSLSENLRPSGGGIQTAIRQAGYLSGYRCCIQTNLRCRRSSSGPGYAGLLGSQTGSKAR